jgi:hypothetical protein
MVCLLPVLHFINEHHVLVIIEDDPIVPDSKPFEYSVFSLQHLNIKRSFRVPGIAFQSVQNPGCGTLIALCDLFELFDRFLGIFYGNYPLRGTEKLAS